MSSFESNKRHLRELLMQFFNLKKSATEAHRLLVETYGEAALNERSSTKARHWKHYWIKIRAKRKKNLHVH